MVQRASSPVDLGSAGVVQINSQSAAPTPRQTAAEHYKVQADQGATTAVLQQLFGAATELGKQAWERSTENAYLEGTTAAAMGGSLEDLDTSPLTSAWATSGFKDTQVQLRQAKAESDFLKELPNLRTKEPDEVMAYLRNTRAAMTDGSSGMSGEGRKSALSRQAAFEQSAVKSWSRARYEYIAETKGAAIQTAAGTVFAGLTGAMTSNNLPEVEAHRNRFFVLAKDGILGDAQLDVPQKQTLLKDLVLRSFQAQDPALYNMLATKEVAPGVTALSLLPAKDQIELSEKQNQVLKATEAKRHIEWGDADAKYDAVIKSDTAELMPESEYIRHLDFGTANGILNNIQERTSRLSAYYRAREKRSEGSNLAMAYQTGNKEFIFQAGKSEQEALTAYRTHMAKSGRTEIDTVVGLLEIHRNHGWNSAALEVGKSIGPLVNSFSNPDGKPNANNAQQFRTVLDTLTKYESESQGGLISSVMAGMPADQRDTFQYMRNAIRSGESDEAVIAGTANFKRYNASLSPAAKAAVSVQNSKDSAALANEFDVRGIWGGLKYGAKRLIGLDTTELAMQPSGPFVDARVSAAYLELSRKEFLMAADMVNQRSPAFDKEQTKEAALTDVKSRLLDTSHGPVFLQHGVDARRYFDAPASADNSQIADAIGRVVKGTVKGSDLFVYSSGKMLYSVEYKDGVVVGNTPIDPASVGKYIRESNSASDKRRNEYYGSGATVNSPAGLPIKFNGNNTATLDNSTMFKLRQNLVKNEGIIDTVKESRSTKGESVLTFGVAVSNSNTAWPKGLKVGDKVPNEMIESTFLAASDEAAKIGAAVARATGINSEASVLLFSEMAYQGGSSVKSGGNYVEMARSMRAGDYASAIKHFRSTPVFQDSGAARRKHYEQLIAQAMKG